MSRVSVLLHVSGSLTRFDRSVRAINILTINRRNWSSIA